MLWLGGGSPVEVCRVVSNHRATDRAPESVTITREHNRREVRVPCSSLRSYSQLAEVRELQAEWLAVEAAQFAESGEVAWRPRFPRVSRR